MVASRDNKLAASADNKTVFANCNLQGSLNYIKHLQMISTIVLLDSSSMNVVHTSACLEEFRGGLAEPAGNSRIPADKKVPSVNIV